MIQENHIESAIKDLFANLRFTAEPTGLYDPLRYMMKIGGKRIRPRLCLTAYSLFKDSFDEAILSPASAIEVFHSFTLIHDDIMDKADVRRGVPTVYRKWDENTAILSGDVMSIESYKLIAKAPADVLPEVLCLFSKTAAEVCEGQQYDMDFETKQKVSVVEYMRMIELKTSVLLAGAVVIGAMLGGASEEDCKTLRRFAIELGLAFQLQDDLLDSYGDERLGKAIGGDILEGKKTYLMITAMSRANEEQREILRSTHLDASLTNAKKIARVKEVYDALDIPHLTEQQIAVRFERALALLDTLQTAPERVEPLREYAKSLMGRNK
jgi:geranylgeranyl diphosphate synthase type II